MDARDGGGARLLAKAQQRLVELGAAPDPPTLWHHQLSDHELGMLGRLETHRADVLEAAGHWEIPAQTIPLA